MAVIRISLENDSRVLIEPVGDISAEDWLSVKSWWSPDSPNTTHPVAISVLPSEFAFKKNWLRENWTRLGHKVELDKGVITSVQAAEALVADFERLATSNSRGEEIDPQSLRLKRLSVWVLRWIIADECKVFV